MRCDKVTDVKFEWDEDKAASNFKKHSIRFEEPKQSSLTLMPSNFAMTGQMMTRIGLFESVFLESPTFCLWFFVNGAMKSSELFQPERPHPLKGELMRKEYDLKKLKKRPGPVRVFPEAAKTAITIRLDAIVVSELRTEAERMGLPYQTLINSVLYRFVTGELVDKHSKKTGTD